MGSVPITLKFTTKRHSRRPYLRLRVQDQDENAFDFTGATGVTFIMYTREDEPEEAIRAPGVIVDPPSSGLLEYPWAVDDLDTEGEFLAEFDVAYSVSEHMTLPKDGHILVKVYPDLDDV